jgi:hypothetical protein
MSVVFPASLTFLPQQSLKKWARPPNSLPISNLDTILCPGKKAQSHVGQKTRQGVLLRVSCQQYCHLTELKRSIFADGTHFFACFAANWGQFFGWYFLNCCCPGVIYQLFTPKGACIQFSQLARKRHKE